MCVVNTMSIFHQNLMLQISLLKATYLNKILSLFLKKLQTHMNVLFKKRAAMGAQRVAQLQATTRTFASSPQPNPFDKVKTQLGGSSFYKLPALGDQRLSKCPKLLPLMMCFYRSIAILHSCSPRVCCKEL